MGRVAPGTPDWGPLLNADLSSIEQKALDALADLASRLSDEALAALVSTSQVHDDKLAGYGDSFIAANQGGETSWLANLGTELSIATHMGGVSGMTSSDIAIRQGGLIPLLTFPSNFIPAAATAVAVTVSPTTVWRSGQTASYVGVVAGVQGTLTYSAGSWTFTRSNAGADVDVLTSEKFIVSGSSDRRGWIQILEGGRNNLDPSTTDAATLALAVRDLDLMARYLTEVGNRRYLVLAIPRSLAETSGTTNYALTKKVNGWLAGRFGDRYLDWQQWMISNGLTLAGINPTPSDRGYINLDVIPISLRENADNLHLNTVAYGLLKDYVKNQMAILGLMAGLLPAVTPSAPAAPTIGAATGSTIPISWTAVTGATAYRVEMKKSSQADSDYVTVGNTTTTSLTVSNLDAGTSYDFRVYAVNVAGSSSAGTKTSGATTGTPPTVTSSDSFNRAATTNINGQTLDNALGGSGTPTWGTTFHMGIDASGQLYNANTANTGYCMTDSGSTNGRVTIRIKQLGGFQGIYARWTSNSDCYAAVVTSTGGINIQRNFGSGVTVLWPVTAGLVKNGDLISLGVNGSTLTLYINNVQVAQVTDTNVVNGTKWGVNMGTDPNARMDEFALSAA